MSAFGGKAEIINGFSQKILNPWRLQTLLNRSAGANAQRRAANRT